MVDWPSGLPQAGLLDFTGGPQPNVVTFKPDVGPTIDRKRASSRVRKRKIRLPPITKEQYATFNSFIEDDLGGGVLPFNWTDPLTNTTVRMKLVPNDPIYDETMLSGGNDGKIAIAFEVQIY